MIGVGLVCMMDLVISLFFVKWDDDWFDTFGML